MAISVKQVIYIVVALMVIGLVLPLGLGMVSLAGEAVITYPNGTETTLKAVVDPAVLTLLVTLLPILAVIGVTLYFIPKGED